MQGTYAEENAKQLPATMVDLGVSKENIIKVSTTALNSENIKDEIKSDYTDSLLKNAKSDSDRLDFGRAITKNVTNSAVLEAVAKGSKYVEDSNVKSQYNTVVETASKNYSPEVQAKVTTALSASNQTNTTTTKASNTQTSTTATNSNTTTTSSASADATTNSAKATGTTKTTVASASNTIVNNKTTSTITSAQTVSSSSNDVSESLSAQKEAVLNKISSYQETTSSNSTSTTSEKEISDEDLEMVEEVLSTEDTDAELEAKFKEFIRKNSMETVYSTVIDKLGTAVIDKMINAVVTYGSSENILALANVIKTNTSLLLKLYTKCPNSEILEMLPKSQIKTLIPQISDLSTLSPNLIYEFLLENKNNWSLNDITKYLKYLPYNLQIAICKEFNVQKGVIDDTTDSELVDSAYVNALEAERTQEYQTQNTQAENSKNATNKKATKAKNTTATSPLAESPKKASSTTKTTKNSEEKISDTADATTLKTGLTRSQQDQLNGLPTEGSDEWYAMYEAQSSLQPTTVANWKLKNPYLA
jgi:hypothetical protein